MRTTTTTEDMGISPNHTLVTARPSRGIMPNHSLATARCCR